MSLFFSFASDCPTVWNELAWKIQRALQDGMSNGSAKRMMSSAIEYMLSNLSKKYPKTRISCDIQSQSDYLNGYYQPVSSTEFFDFQAMKIDFNKLYNMHKLDGDNEKFCYCKSLAIPDVICYYNLIPGGFILCIECKKHNDIYHAKAQLYEQMFTQMHFRKYLFGIVLLGDQFAVVFMVKVDCEIRVYEFNDTFEISHIFERASQNQVLHKFIPEKLTDFFTWIYWILEYHIRNPA